MRAIVTKYGRRVKWDAPDDSGNSVPVTIIREGLRDGCPTFRPAELSRAYINQYPEKLVVLTPDTAVKTIRSGR